MIRYQPTEADRRPLPGSYGREARYLGYRNDDRTRPFARYFEEQVRPVPAHVRDALLAGQSPSEYGYEIDEAASRLSRPGYHKMETGSTLTGRRTRVVACLTDMPGVTAEMWDWWFGWHSTDSARYKLWHPDAHQFSAIGDDRSTDRSLTSRQRYIDNVSYVDEYIGPSLSRLAIRFVDPSRLGFEERPGTTVICARVTTSDLPVAGGWLVHQVRPTDHGAEMRSRFFLGHPEILELPPSSTSNPKASAVFTSRAGRTLLSPVVARMARPVTSERFGHDLLFHCASEMHHLAGFLSALYDEFRHEP